MFQQFLLLPQNPAAARSIHPGFKPREIVAVFHPPFSVIFESGERLCNSEGVFEIFASYFFGMQFY